MVVGFPVRARRWHGLLALLPHWGPQGLKGRNQKLHVLSPLHFLLPPSASLPTAQPPSSSTLVFLSWKQKPLLLFFPLRQTCDVAPQEGPVSR